MLPLRRAGLPTSPPPPCPAACPASRIPHTCTHTRAPTLQILAFNVDTLNLRLGGWKTAFKLKPRREAPLERQKEDPFFSFFWMSDDFIAGRGRSGGIAFWARTTPQWELEKGVV